MGKESNSALRLGRLHGLRLTKDDGCAITASTQSPIIYRALVLRADLPSLKDDCLLPNHP
jgi:hypothetical protein